MKKNIAILESNILGSNSIRRKLVETLIAEGHKVTILAIGPQDEIELARARGFTVVDLKYSNQKLSEILPYLKNIKKALKNINPDVLLTFTIRSAIWGNIVTRYLNIPTITSITGIGPLFESNHFTYKAARIFYKFALKKTEKIFFQNKTDMNLFIEKGFVLPSKTIIVPGSGIDFDYYKPMDTVKENNKTIFLFIGRLMKDKGILEFLEAARILKCQHTDVEFRVAGPFWSQNLKQNIISQPEVDTWVKEGLVKYLGAAEDIRPHIASADCIVLPSYREGLSNVLLEAGSMEKPCITCDVPGCNDVVIDEKTGLLCKVRDAGDLAKKMKKLYEMPLVERIAMGKAARVRIIQNFDKKIVLNAYLKAIDEID